MNARENSDMSESAFTPIHGVTLDRFAELSAAIDRQRLTGSDQVDAWLETMGIPADTWQEIERGWSDRMAANAQVRNRYGVLVGRF